MISNYIYTSLCLGSKITADVDCSREIGMFASWPESYDKPREFVSAEEQRHYSADKGPYSQGSGLPSGHARLWKLDHKEDGATKNWCLWSVVLEKTPESPLDCKEIQPVNLKGNPPWIFIGRTDAEVETAVFWSSVVNSWLIGKVWCRERLKVEEEEGIRGWDGWMASLMQWTWAWADFRRWWGTKRPGVLPGHGVTKNWIWLGDWATTSFQVSLCVCVCVCVRISTIIDNSNKIPCFTKQSSQKIIFFSWWESHKHTHRVRCYLYLSTEISQNCFSGRELSFPSPLVTPTSTCRFKAWWFFQNPPCSFQRLFYNILFLGFSYFPYLTTLYLLLTIA